MQVVATVEDALSAIDSFGGQPEDFVLCISDDLLDPVGVNMAIIGDRILGRNWMVDDFEQRKGFRIYRFKGW